MDNINNVNNINDINSAPTDTQMTVEHQNTAMQDLCPPVAPSVAYQPPKRSKFIEILIALAKCAGYIFVWLGVQTILMTIFSVVIMLSNPSLGEAALNEKILGYSIELTIASNLIALAIYFLIFFIARKSLLKKIDISLPNKFSYLPTLAIGATGQLVTGLVLSILMNANVFPQKWIDALNENSDLVTNANPVLSFFAVVILAPVFEELLCRGLILKTLHKTMPKWFAIVLSSAIFGIVHGNPIQFIYATALGIILGWLYTKFDSIWIPILCHLAFNLTSTLLGYLNPDSEITNITIALLSLASVPIFTLVIVYINLKNFKKKPATVSVNQPSTTYQFNSDPEYNASVIRNLEDEIEGKKTHVDNNKE